MSATLLADPTSGARPVSVRGGAYGIEARCADLVRLARLFGHAAEVTLGRAAALHRVLIAPAMAAATVWDPTGGMRVEYLLLRTLDGRSGLLDAAAGCARIDLELRAAAAAYGAADRLDSQVGPALDGMLRLPAAGGATARALVQRRPGRALTAALSADPELADAVVAGMSGFWGAPLRLQALAQWPDGRAIVTRFGADESPDAGRPPRSVEDLLRALAARSTTTGGGDIDVRVLTSDPPAGGAPVRRVIVDIPGTRSWGAGPHDPEVANLGTDLRAITGARTTYEQGVIEALRQAGVSPRDEVLLVGHSEGGMVALAAARDLARSGEFHVTHVVTAGSPIARIPTPAGVQVLALENAGDVVPHLDGARNPDRRRLTTVSLDRDQGDIGLNHDLERSYVPGGADVDASTDPSVQAYLAGLRGFLCADQADTTVFHVRRG